MTSKHHRWQIAWQADPAAGVATHETGFIVSACAPSPASPSATGPQFLASVPGGIDSEALRAWLAGQPALRDPASQQARIQRLSREGRAIIEAAAQGLPAKAARLK